MAEILTEQQLSDSDIFIETDVKLLVDDIYNFNNNKLQKYKSQYPPNHIVHIRGATEVFVTSDIHADYRKFVQLLSNGGFIKFPVDIDDIYNPCLISECEWIKKDCLIVIVGDLVDGRRITPLSQLQKKNPDATESEFKAEVNDTVGNFEFLLHMLIYNLRIKGKKVNSNILFTIGNHDLELLLNHENYLQAFVHSQALKYYGKNPYLIRKLVLSHFFSFSPYILLLLETNINKNEILCIHAGIHNKTDKDYNLDKIIEIQDQINENGLGVLKDILIDDLYKAGKIGELSHDSSLRDRYYATGEQLCDKNKDFKYLLTVVGHSPGQADYTGLEKVKLTGEEYNKCDTKDEYKGRGCIVFKCSKHIHEMPRIVLVDTAMSGAFTNASKRKPDDEITRSIEFLHLTHEEKETKNYFNRMYKYVINNQNNNATDEIVYPKLESIAEQKYLKYKVKYIKLKNQI